MLLAPPFLSARREKDAGKKEEEKALRGPFICLFVLSIIIDPSSSEGRRREKVIPKRADYRARLPMYVLLLLDAMDP
jgi:hypothetical protein